MSRRLQDHWWYIERPVPLPLILAGLFVLAGIGWVAWLVIGH